MPGPLDFSAIDNDYNDASTYAKKARGLYVQALADYNAAGEAIVKSNASRQAYIDGSGDLEAKLTKLRDDSTTLLTQQGDLPPVIPELEPFQPVAPVMARSRR